MPPPCAMLAELVLSMRGPCLSVARAGGAPHRVMFLMLALAAAGKPEAERHRRQLTATYSLATSGTCSSAGLYNVANKADCDSGASALGLSDTTASVLLLCCSRTIRQGAPFLRTPRVLTCTSTQAWRAL